mgnify:FL=1
MCEGVDGDASSVSLLADARVHVWKFPNQTIVALSCIVSVVAKGCAVGSGSAFVAPDPLASPCFPLTHSLTHCE